MHIMVERRKTTPGQVVGSRIAANHASTITPPACCVAFESLLDVVIVIISNVTIRERPLLKGMRN